MMLQHTEEWTLARLGKATASRMGDVIKKTKNGSASATRKRYRGELLAERQTGSPYPNYVTAEMQRGIDLQPQAQLEYEKREGVLVSQVGFVPHPTIAMSGASPDGLVGSDGLVEIKCPSTHEHIDVLLDPTNIDMYYFLQMQWQMACTGRKWCDFVSYDDRLSPGKVYRRWRVAADAQTIAGMEIEVVKFLAEVDKMNAELNALYPELDMSQA